MSAWLLLWACAVPPAADTAALVEDTGGLELVPLDDLRLARRLSLDLRGTLPTAAELEAIEADPEHGLEDFRGAVFADERFAERLVLLFQEQWHTRVDSLEVPPQDYGFEQPEYYAFHRSIGEEPLRLAAHVVTEDLPWTEVVLADYTVADDLLVELWGLEPVDDDAAGWRPVRYPDARPHRGLLTTNGMWWRYTTTVSNKNRARASTAVRLLLCDDYLARPITFSRSADLSSDVSDNSAISDEACLGCHASLDPLAATFFGFYTTVDYNLFELETYHPEREVLGPYMLDVEPAYFGTPVDGLADVGRLMAEDPRLARCAAQTAAKMVWRRELTLDDFTAINELEEVFLAEDMRFAALLAEATRADPYIVGDASGPADLVGELPTRHMLNSHLLWTALDELAALDWEDSLQRPMLDYSEVLGLSVLGGSVDGELASRPQDEPSLTWALTVKRAAEAAAVQATTRELIEGGERVLYGAKLDTTHTPGDDVFEAELERLHLRILARRPTETERDDLVALWEATTEATTDPAMGWVAVVSVLLRDPDFVNY